MNELPRYFFRERTFGESWEEIQSRFQGLELEQAVLIVGASHHGHSLPPYWCHDRPLILA